VLTTLPALQERDQSRGGRFGSGGGQGGFGDRRFSGGRGGRGGSFSGRRNDRFGSSGGGRGRGKKW
jgi:ATP-dependent RNA helicase DDX21